MISLRVRRTMLSAVILFSLAACKKGEIAVYRVPKEAAAPAMAARPSGGNHPEWKVPARWKEQPASGMRVGSFLASGSNGKDVDVSVVPLSGEAGGELANVNRWRGQLGLPAVTDSDLSSIAKSTRIGEHQARVVEFSNGQGKRLLAAMLRSGSTTWFFKAAGDDDAVKEIKPAFLAFVGSVRFPSHE